MSLDASQEIQIRTKAVLLFAITSALYFVSRSPALDEIDSVNFAMGIRHFDLWNHQPHPPGYPLFVFAGWIGVRLFGISPELSLHIASALGGALLVAAWFLIVRLQFNERLAWWVSGCLAITPVIWMTATKVLSDTLAAGLVSAQILAGLHFSRSGRRASLLATSLLGAAGAGVRPQLFLVVLTVLITALWWRKPRWTMSIFGVGALVVGCLLWLVPMWYLQWRLHPDNAIGTVYPHLVHKFWAGRLHKPSAYLFAGDWSPRYLGTRLTFHFLGWFGLGFGLIQSWVGAVAGVVILSTGLVSYLFWSKEIADGHFWKFHLPWAVVHITAIFVSLPATQRYYVIIFPLLLVALLRGFLRLSSPWQWSVLALPAVLFFNLIPTVIANHRDEPPPLRTVRYLERLYPESARKRIVLLLSTRTKRHAEWYAPGFVTINPIPPPETLSEITRDAVAVYTDDPDAPLPGGWYRIPLIAFSRSVVIYWKAHFVELYLIEGRGAQGDKK